MYKHPGLCLAGPSIWLFQGTSCLAVEEERSFGLYLRNDPTHAHFILSILNDLNMDYPSTPTFRRVSGQAGKAFGTCMNVFRPARVEFTIPAYLLSHWKPFDQQISSALCSKYALNSITGYPHHRCNPGTGCHRLSPGSPQYLPHCSSCFCPSPSSVWSLERSFQNKLR